jgi:hypothetical protein
MNTTTNNKTAAATKTERQKLSEMVAMYDAFRLSRIRSLAARLAEREARLQAYELGDDDGAPGYELVMAPGCYGGPVAPTAGYVWTLDAAEDLAAQQTHMPGGTSHCRLAIA